ncbi:MAG TPA: DUF1552 domain-containing protein [Rariglobus sp.]
MILRQTPLSRRTILRGAGASLALPWLEAMMPRAGAATTPAAPVRMAVLYMANGTREDMWTPEGSGTDFKLSPTLAPLEDLKDRLLIPTNLWNQSAKGSEGHYIKTAGFLTSTTVTKTLGVDLNCNGVSMDQLAAQAAGQKTPVPSLELGIAPVTTGVDTNVGYTRVYGSHISWSAPTSPVAKELNPRMVYERLLRSTKPQTNSAKDDLLLLDEVRDDAKALREKLGQADRIRLDEYLSVVRSLEERVGRVKLKQNKWSPRAPFHVELPPEEPPKVFADHVKLMLDMMAMAFQTDTTRIVTFMFGNAVSGQNMSFIDGVQGGHHNISHHMNDADKLRQYQLIATWHVEQYGYLLRKLKSMQEGESNVLDNSMIVFGAGLRDGNKHDPHNLPIVVAGRAGGRIASGRHLVYDKDTPLANLWLSMLHAFGSPVERFSDSTGKLPGVLA